MANGKAFLPEFIANYNSHFAVQPHSTFDFNRPLAPPQIRNGPTPGRNPAYSPTT